MKDGSVWPPAMSRLSKPLSSATFVPTRGARWTSASRAVGVRRGSTTTSAGDFGPARRSSTRAHMTVWFTVAPGWEGVSRAVGVRGLAGRVTPGRRLERLPRLERAGPEDRVRIDRLAARGHPAQDDGRGEAEACQ